MTFKGNPLDFRKFLRQFKVKVLANTDDNDERFNYLEQFTEDEVKSIVRSYGYLDSVYAFPAAMKELEERYGDEAVIVNAFIDKALDWPQIKADNPKQLDAFAVYLAECEHAVKNDILDYTEHIKKIVSKLPYLYQERFRSEVQKIREAGRNVKFSNLVHFIRKEAKKANDPMFGKDALQAVVRHGNMNPKSKNPTMKPKLSLATDVTARTPRSPANITATNQTQKTPTVKYCTHCDSETHVVTECLKFKALTLQERLKVVQDKGLCFRCLKRGHLSKFCRSSVTCSTCQRRHNTLLHDNSIQAEDRGVNAVSLCTETDMGVGGETDTLCKMVIIPVKVIMKDKLQTVDTYAFLDPGSSATFCTESLMNKLGISGKKMKINIDTMSKPCSMYTNAISGIQVCDWALENKITLPKVYTVRKLPVSEVHIPTQEDIARWPHLTDIEVPKLDAEIGLMISNNVPDAYSPIEVRTGSQHTPHASRTRLGWALWNVTRPVNGSDCQQEIDCSVNLTMVSSVQDSRILKQLDQLVHQSFDIDFPERLIEEEKQNSQEDKLFLKRVKDSIELKEGHYELALPFKNKDAVFPNNYTLAHQRLMGLKRRFEKNNKYFLEYQAFMNKMFEKGYAEAIQDDEPEVAEGQVWYIPHHGVYHPKKRKLRVVFNCAAKCEGTSLNDQLLSGPDLTNSLIGVLLRFRQENFAAMGDIESMFYQVRVKDTHKNYQRFLWWKDGNFRKPPQKCRMTVHMFGTTSSASCANIALLRTAADNKEDYDTAITDIVRSNFYVDDCLMSHADESKLVEQVTQVTDLCETEGFKLTKWMSNSAKVLEELPQEYQAENMKDVRLDLLRGTSGNAEKDVSIERALGVVWKLQNDTLGFKVEVQPKENTKRNILSIVSSIYDPLGIVSPFVLQAKLLLRNICQQGLGWDEQTTGTLCDQWNRWLTELPLLEEVHVPRCFKSTGIVKTYQLHIFCDASEDGYGVAVYLRTVMEDNTINCNLVMAKSRVCPLKRVTIPRLELTAACVSVRISHAIQKELRIHLDDVYHWTDSMTVIRYIFNEATRFKTFVANRLTVIRDGTDPCQWKHVPGASNPADAASMGLRLPTLLKSEVWFHGPSFLFKPECDWPLTPEPKNSVEEDDPEIKTVVSTVITDDSVNTMDKLLTQFSSWMKLKRIVGWYLLYIENLQKKTRQKQESLKSSTQRIKGNTPETKRSKPYLTVRILQKSENAIFKYLQNQHFKDVLHHLTSEQRNETPKFRKDIRKLCPILSDGLIRVGGRLRQASLSFETRHPILLPKNSHVSKLIVCNSHEEVGHMGKAAMLTYLRQRYWILGAGALIKNVLSHCVVCRKYEARQKEQMMSDLPCDRLTTDEPPFSRVGVDFFGPFIVKRGRGCIKRYGVVFTCLTLRAIHLELSSSLDTSSCINAFRRFFARRGHPKKIRSDNGTNLVGCKKELEEEIRKWNHEQMHHLFLQRNIKWEFTPPSGSHQGGAWERMIRTIRKILYALLQTQVVHLDDDGLYTLFCKVECIVNNRPLTTVSPDIHDLTPLTPNHLLMSKSCDALPPGLFTADDSYAQRRWRQVQYFSDIFWKRFSREYLTSLQQRQKWTRPRGNVAVNDVVLIMDNLPRNAWRLGRVLEVHPTKRGYVRIVKVKTQSTTLTRPIDKLAVVLEDQNNKS